MIPTPVQAAPRGRLLLRIVMACLVLAAATHTALWWTVTGRIMAGWPVFVAQAEHDGWTINSETPYRAGWPLAATLRIPHLTATRQLGETRFAGTLDRVDITIHPTDAHALLIVPEGAGTVQLGGAAPIPLRAASAALRAPLEGQQAMLLTVRDLVAGAAASVRLQRIDLQVLPDAAAGAATGIAVSPALPPPFDGLANLAGRVILTPPFPPAATPGASARAWQQAGGRAAIPELHLDWGPLQAEGSLFGQLDPRLQPEVEGRLRVQGGLEVLDAASRSGVIQAGPASAARAVLGLLSMASRGAPVVLPVTLHDNTLTIAQFALARVPLLNWDAP